MGRRSFLRAAGAAAALLPTRGFPAILKLRKPCEMLSHAAIGCGNQARYDLGEIASHPEVNITALCDVDSAYLEEAHRRFPDARIYRDAFEMFAAEGDKIDSVNVSTPDHTHAQYIVEALKRGLNVYGQKPLCHDLAESRAVARLAAEKKVVTQMGTQIAAWQCDRRTADVISRGWIGEISHVWLFSTRRPEPNPSRYRWPRESAPVPETLDWKLWLGPAKWRQYAAGSYHPGVWRMWRDFCTSWLGDLGLHLMSPVWLGMQLGDTLPESVTAEISDDDWTPEQREQFWPTMSHVTWTFPGIKASGMKPFEVEWCDGFGNVAFRLEPKFLPPARLRDIAALTPMGDLPAQGRVIEGSEGWILSTHYDKEPYCVLKNGTVVKDLPGVKTAPTHYHQYADCCLRGGRTTSPFSMACRLTEWGFLGNLAQLRPGERLDCAEEIKKSEGAA